METKELFTEKLKKDTGPISLILNKLKVRVYTLPLQNRKRLQMVLNITK